MNDYHEEATEWLKREDGVGREDRTARLQWIASLMPQVEHLTFPGGVLSKYHFEEMRYCFVYGQYLAVVLLGLAYIERTLAASFYGAGRNDLERASISTLLREAVASGMITGDDFERIDHAREIRNAFTHFRRPSHEENITRDQHSGPNEVSAKRATPADPRGRTNHGPLFCPQD